MMHKVSNVKVYCRLGAPSTTTFRRNSLPASYSHLNVCDGGKESLECFVDGGIVPTSVHEFDGVLESDGNDYLLTRLGLEERLNGLFRGQSTGIITMGMQGEVIGKRNGLLTTICNSLQTLCESDEKKKNLNISASFAFLGISDGSCIDLSTYARKEIADLKKWQAWCPLPHSLTSIDEAAECVEQGYSLPSILMIRLLVKPVCGDDLPASLATLTVADLGSCVESVNLERSLSSFKSQIVNLTQNIVKSHENSSSSNDCNYDDDGQSETFLSTLLGDCFGGGCESVVVADLPKDGLTRHLGQYMHFLDTLRLVKNHPCANFESPEMLELGVLVEAHAALEEEHGRVKRDLCRLERSLRKAEDRQKQLESARHHTSLQTKVDLAQQAYQTSLIKYEKIKTRQGIRDCEIKLVCMEHERLLLLNQMHEKQEKMAAMEARLQKSLEEKQEITLEYQEEIYEITEKLKEATESTNVHMSEKNKLKVELEEATEMIVNLKAEIMQERSHNSNAHEKSLAEKEATEAKLEALSAKLSTTQDREQSLQANLRALNDSTQTHLQAKQELEGKLASLRIENTALKAKLDVLSASAAPPRSPAVNKTVRAMEEKWQEEKNAMHSLLSDLRGMIVSQQQQNNNNNNINSHINSHASGLNGNVPMVAFNQQAAAAAYYNAIGANSSLYNNNHNNSLPMPVHQQQHSTATTVERQKTASKSAKRLPAQKKKEMVLPELSPSSPSPPTKEADLAKFVAEKPKSTKKRTMKPKKAAAAPLPPAEPLEELFPRQDEADSPAKNVEKKIVRKKLPPLLNKLPRKDAEAGKTEEIKEKDTEALPKTTRKRVVSKEAKNDLVLPAAALPPPANISADRPPHTVENINSSKVPVPEEEEESVPGTPEKPKQSKWKASSFKPTQSHQQSTTVHSKPKENLGLLANLSFKGGDAAKRIKLPTRNKATLLTTTNTLTHKKTNLDPNAYGTIMNSFNIPPSK